VPFSRPGGRDGRGGTRGAAAAPLHAQVRPGKDLARFSNWPGAASARAETCPCGCGAGYIVSDCVRISDWGGVVSAFSVIDLWCAVTTSIGMMQLPPVIISTPLRFCVRDGGWLEFAVGSLMKSLPEWQSRNIKTETKAKSENLNTGEHRVSRNGIGPDCSAAAAHDRDGSVDGAPL